MVVRKIPKKFFFEKNQAERSAYSESRGPKTLNFKIWAQSEQLFFFEKIGKIDIYF